MFKNYDKVVNNSKRIMRVKIQITTLAFYDVYNSCGTFDRLNFMRLPIYRVRISSWIFELDFRVWSFLAGFFLFFGGVSNKFSVVLHNVLCHRLEVFSRWRRTRMADR